MSHTVLTEPWIHNRQFPPHQTASTPSLEAISAVAISIISTLLCFMLLPPQGAAFISSIAWIFAFKCCLDANAPEPTNHPSRLNNANSVKQTTRSAFYTPQKPKLPRDQRPGFIGE